MHFFFHIGSALSAVTQEAMRPWFLKLFLGFSLLNFIIKFNLCVIYFISDNIVFWNQGLKVSIILVRYFLVDPSQSWNLIFLFNQ